MITVFFGPPGSGKGTQAAVVAQRLGVPHVSTGAILREEVAAKSPLGLEAAPIMDRGQLVPDDLMLRIIEHRLSQPDAAGGAILDGFPRTRPQAEALDAMLTRRGWRVGVVIALDVPDSILAERIVARGVEEGRSDDSIEAFRTRMTVYNEETLPVLRYYESSGAKIEPIDGVGTVEEVTSRIAGALVPGRDEVAP